MNTTVYGHETKGLPPDHIKYLLLRAFECGFFLEQLPVDDFAALAYFFDQVGEA